MRSKARSSAASAADRGVGAWDLGVVVGEAPRVDEDPQLFEAHPDASDEYAGALQRVVRGAVDHAAGGDHEADPGELPAAYLLPASARRPGAELSGPVGAGGSGAGLFPVAQVLVLVPVQLLHPLL